MKNKVSYRLLLLVAVLSVAIFSLNTFVILPLALVSDQPQQLLQSAFATFPGENGKIAFVRPVDRSQEIYTINADGSIPTRLTSNEGDSQPSWSPDGTKIAFASLRDDTGYDKIYVMNADGSEVTKLTNGPNIDACPTWSPDGTKIAYSLAKEILSTRVEKFM